jgi:DNA-binding NtrC family response regulator
MVARAIQGSSDRAGRPFVPVNCGAIPDNLVESILFGHERGSFTGASDRHVGKFQEADGGTLFLDEIGELTLGMQVKLLRALQEGEVDPVGSKRPVKVDIRLISATNRNLQQLVQEGKFREDLYYRLNVYPIFVPPLRERRDDVTALVRHFIESFAASEGKKVRDIGPEAMQMLEAYKWPGNVRQLENAIFRAIVLADGDVLTIGDFPQIAQLMGMAAGEAEGLGAGRGRNGVSVITAEGELRKLEDVEGDMIRLAITRYRGQMSEVARRLGIGRSTLYRKVRELGIDVRGEP